MKTVLPKIIHWFIIHRSVPHYIRFAIWVVYPIWRGTQIAHSSWLDPHCCLNPDSISWKSPLFCYGSPIFHLRLIPGWQHFVSCLPGWISSVWLLAKAKEASAELHAAELGGEEAEMIHIQWLPCDQWSNHFPKMGYCYQFEKFSYSNSITFQL